VRYLSATYDKFLGNLAHTTKWRYELLEFNEHFRHFLNFILRVFCTFDVRLHGEEKSPWIGTSTGSGSEYAGSCGP
jgi:hypothetical protein